MKLLKEEQKALELADSGGVWEHVGANYESEIHSGGIDYNIIFRLKESGLLSKHRDYERDPDCINFVYRLTYAGREALAKKEYTPLYAYEYEARERYWNGISPHTQYDKHTMSAHLLTIANEVKRMQAREEWLAIKLATQGDICGGQPICPVKPEEYNCVLRTMGVCKASETARAECWRMAADMATRGNAGSSGEVTENPGEE